MFSTIFGFFPAMLSSGRNAHASDTVAGQQIDLASGQWEENLQPCISRQLFLQYVAASPVDRLLEHFHSATAGISEEEAAQRLRKVGRNVLSVKKPLVWWKMLLFSIPNPFNLLLGVLAIISVSTPPPTWSSFVILMVMIIASVLVRFWQEYRSNLASVKLQGTISANVCVLRPAPGEKMSTDCHSTTTPVSSECIVPGDVIALSPGDSVPADCLILSSNQVRVSQSSLTGESAPQRKLALQVPQSSAQSVLDLANIAFMGSSVISGSATALVLATGDRAFIASITEHLNKKRHATPFERGILNVSYLMIGFMVTTVTVVLVIRGKLSGDWAQAAIFSLSVAVGIVPEMLPALVNANLARGAFLLAKKGAIVKSIASVQNLGSMTVLCSDKTGTLTQDDTVLSCAENCHGAESRAVRQLAYTNAFYQSGKKNTIDAAIIRANTWGDDVVGQLVADLPFDFEKRRSSVVVRAGEQTRMLICKGAFEEVLGLCDRLDSESGPKTMTESDRQELLGRAHKHSDDGYRVLAVATSALGPVDITCPDALENAHSSLVLQGFLTFLDPPRDDAAASVASLQALGIEVKVLTGDSLRTASRICQSLNIASKDLEGGLRAVTGPELFSMDTAEFDATVQDTTVFAKLTPEQKGQVIASLKKQPGRSVGMLGDGINDCIALRAADVGISVNNAVSVAKDCADVILTEKSLSIVLSGVRVGRRTHGNTVKYIKMVASSNFGNVFSVLIASIWLPYEPMTSLQILVQNLLYDLSQVALPWDRVDDEYLARPQAWDTLDLLRFVLFFGPLSSTIDVCTFCLGRFYYGVRSANDPGVALFHTHWFLEGLLTQTVVVHILRTAKVPFFQSRPAPALVVATLSIMGIGLCIPYIAPLARVLAMVKPASSFIGFLGGELLVYCLEVQLMKLFYIRMFGKWL